MANGRSRVIEETTELGIGMLIAESEDGAYEPVAPVSTIREARDMAREDLRGRMADLEEGGDHRCVRPCTASGPGTTAENSPAVAEIDAN